MRIIIYFRSITARKIKSANPDYEGVSHYAFVGMGALDPHTHFHEHKAGIYSNTYVTLYAYRLAPELAAELKQPISYGDVRNIQVDVAIKLKELGSAVRQA